MSGLYDHVRGGLTTICHCWAVTRSDGAVMGFTDHDEDLRFAGVTFEAHTGLSASALQQSTGLSVDNTEALGALSDDAIREEDIEAGRFDNAEIRAWLVNWANLKERELLFRGHIGELRRAGGGFEAELRGLTDVLNQPTGRVYQKNCGRDLGDRGCRFDLNDPAYFAEAPVSEVEERRIFRFDGLRRYALGWFRFGTFVLQSGAGKDLTGVIKRDYIEGDQRVIELWHPIRAALAPGDRARLQAGCDKTLAHCREKFGNILNFQGFPDIPGDDWSYTDPLRADQVDGGSRRS